MSIGVISAYLSSCATNGLYFSTEGTATAILSSSNLPNGISLFLLNSSCVLLTIVCLYCACAVETNKNRISSRLGSNCSFFMFLHALSSKCTNKTHKNANTQVTSSFHFKEDFI